MAVNEGASWQQIIDKYYGGTAWANTGNRALGVRLLWADGRPDTTVVSMVGAVTWNGGAGTYGSMHAFQVGANVYDVYGASGIGCAGVADRLGAASGGSADPSRSPRRSTRRAPRRATCSVSAGRTARSRTTAAPSRPLTDGTANRTVNVLLIENYLKGVLPREVPATWGRSGGGAGHERAVGDGRGRPLVRPLAGPLLVRPDV